MTTVYLSPQPLLFDVGHVVSLSYIIPFIEVSIGTYNNIIVLLARQFYKAFSVSEDLDINRF